MIYEDWLAARRQGITGTDCATLLGKNPWKKEDDLILEKLGLGKPFTGNAATKTGVLLESHVANLWSRDNQKIITQGEFTIKEDLPWAIGTPDFLYPGGVLEVKTGGENTFKKGLPEHYRLQVLWYCFITGREEGYLEALIVPKDRSECPQDNDDADYTFEWCANRPRRSYHIPPDPPLLEQMLEKAELFLARLAKIRASRL